MRFLWLLIAWLNNQLDRSDKTLTSYQDAGDVPDSDPDVVAVPPGTMPSDSLRTEYAGGLPTPTDEPPPPQLAQREQRYLWIINGGHGRLQPGKRSPVVKQWGRRFFEWKWNRDVKALVFERLDDLGIAYYDVVPEDDVGSFLTKRIRRGNAYKSDLPKLWVGIHANTAATPNLDTWENDATGTETWCYHDSVKGRKMAGIFQRHMLKALGLRSRGVKSKTTGQFAELEDTHMPSCVLEPGFYNNYFECLYLAKETTKEAFADAIVEAILEVEEYGL